MPLASGGGVRVLPIVAVVVVASFAGCSSSPPAADPPDATPGATADAAPSSDPIDAAAPASYPCAPEMAAGHQEIDCPDGVHFDVEASDACLAGGCALLLDLHGLTSTGDQADAHTRFRALAPPLGYVVLQPTSPGQLHEWSSGMWDDSVWSFVRAAVDRYGIDRDRVHVTGFSQGGMMTLRLLCAHADEIASVAPSAGGGCFDGSHGPAVPRPILYTHGTKDAVIAFSAGAAVRDNAIARWNLGGEEVFTSGPQYTATRWTDASGAVMLEFWQHDFTAPPLLGFYALGGHCLPGPPSDQPYRCQEPEEYDQSVEILRFFDAHHRE